MKTNPIGYSLVKNSLWNFLFTLISRAGGILFIALISRALLPENFGIYNLALSIAMIFFSFADLGINKVAMTYISEALSKNYENKAKSHFNYLIKLKLVISFIVSFVLLIVAYPISYIIFNQQMLFIPLILFSVYIFILSISSFFEALFFTIGNVKDINTKELIYQIARIILVFLTFLFLTYNYYLYGVIISLILSLMIILTFLILKLRRREPRLFGKRNYIEKNKKNLLKFMFYVTIGSISGLFFGYVDTAILGFFTPPSYIGFYSAGFAIIGSLVGFFSFSNIFLPAFSKTSRKNSFVLFNKIFRYTMILTIPSATGIVFLSRYVIYFLYGSDYLQAVVPLCILSILLIEIPFSNLLSSLLLSRKKAKQNSKFLATSAIINVILNIILASILVKISFQLILVGIASSTIFSRVVYSLLLVRYSKKDLNLKIPFYHLVKPVIASIIMVLALTFINYSISSMSLLIGVVEIIVGILVYFLVLFFLREIKKEDIQLLNQIKHSTSF